MVANQTRPPDKALVGERWREMWIERLRTMPLFVGLWLEHQQRDEYWRHGSVCEDFSSIQCPVYAVGGWDDSYTNAIPRLLAGLKVPKKGLIGPWAHRYPHIGLPGPQIGFLQESLRWWDKWLKGIETGIMDEPMLRAWVQDSVRPAPWYAERPGRWVAESAWPSRGITAQKKYLTAAGISERPGPEQPMLLASPETVGALSGMWCPHGLTSDDPLDQREEDAKSLVFDTAPLDERVEILGAAIIDVELSSDRPNAKLIIRLCDVHPDGASTRVCYGILNLTHRDGHDAAKSLEPGRRYRVRLQLNDVGYAFPPGNRIRIALSSTYWPLTWPSPERVTLTVYGGTASIALPVRSHRPEDADLAPLPPAEVSPPEARTVLRKGVNFRRITRDVGSGRTVFLLRDDDGRVRIDSHGLEIGSAREHEFSITDDEPLSARAETRWTKEIGRGDWQTRAVTRTIMTSTKDEFVIKAKLDAFENETRVYSNNWERRIKRDLV
jgi:hypothetical protein